MSGSCSKSVHYITKNLHCDTFALIIATFLLKLTREE